MTKARSKEAPSFPDKKHFEALTAFVNRVSVGSARQSFFTLCVKASLSKCFEFNLAVRSEKNLDESFFWMPALRGICEDLIVLNFVKTMPRSDRDKLILKLMAHDVRSRISLQDRFFKDIHIHQPVLRIKDVANQIVVLESEIQQIWKRHGWNLSRGTMPQIRQIAERQGHPVLASLYDYLYRSTSAAVHFNVQSLLRSGWGPSKVEFTFSTKNFSPYFRSYARVYGAFLFCVYFEFFGRFLRPGSVVARRVAEIRKELLLTPRWPEMVTFEEMNLEPPKTNIILETLLAVVESENRKRLIS
ncbi:MAG: DUF5677 domain-containing protein [Blastocatellia bacterium]